MRERTQAGEGAEGEAGSMQGAQHGTWSQVPRIMLWAKGRRLTAEPPRHPKLFYYLNTLCLEFVQKELIYNIVWWGPGSVGVSSRAPRKEHMLGKLRAPWKAPWRILVLGLKGNFQFRHCRLTSFYQQGQMSLNPRSVKWRHTFLFSDFWSWDWVFLLLLMSSRH